MQPAARRSASPRSTTLPVVATLGAAESYTEDSPLDLTDIAISDVDSAMRHRHADAVRAWRRQPQHRHLRGRDLDL